MTGQPTVADDGRLPVSTLCRRWRATALRTLDPESLKKTANKKRK
jgi:hypothetical protein